MYEIQIENKMIYFDIIIIIFLIRRYVQPTQQRHLVNGYTRNTQYIILLFIGFFVVVFGLYFTSIQSNTVVFPSGK